MTADTFCDAGKPIWSIKDTPETIAEQLARAEMWDRRCAGRGRLK